MDQGINNQAISAELAAFAANLRSADIPQSVFERITELYIDWAGSCFSGKDHKAITAIEKFGDAMGPAQGPSEILISGKRTSPLFAAMINGAASHISEQDDVHNGSVFHPATVVFPPALAIAQECGASGEDFLVACIAGYEVGIRVGEYLGRSHYEIFHTTGTAGTFASAAAVGHLLQLDAGQMNHAFGSAGTQSAGLWEFLRDAADSKQLHTAKASIDGLMAAWLAAKGFTGAQRVLEGRQGLAAGTSTDADPLKAIDGLGTRWTVLETSFKYHASCRHTHPAADAMLQLVTKHDLGPDDIGSVTAHVHQGAIDVLGAVKIPQSVHQAKFSMGATLGLIATHRRAGLVEYQNVLSDDAAMAFVDKVTMELDEEVDREYPARWIGKVTAVTKDQRTFTARINDPKGDPGNMLTRAEIDNKNRMLALSGGAVDVAELDRMMEKLWSVKEATIIPYLT